MRYMIVSLVLILTSFMASAENLVIRSFALPKHGTFELKIPASWNDSVAQRPGGQPPTITLSPKMGAQFQVLVTPMWSARPDMKSASPDELRTTVRRAADSAAQQSVEKSIAVKELKGSANIGYYFTATDRAPQPGEFKYLNQGMIAVNDLRVAFTILTNDGQEANVKEALSILLLAESR